jgi:hypothetical protein
MSLTFHKSAREKCRPTPNIKKVTPSSVNWQLPDFA